MQRTTSPVIKSAREIRAPELFTAPVGELELVNAFATESRELINKAEGALVALEANAADVDSGNRAFRAIHTIKGTAYCFPFTPLADLAHLSEDMLAAVRDGEMPCQGGFADLLLQACDMMHVLVDQLEQSAKSGSFHLPRTYNVLMSALADPAMAGVDVHTSLSLNLQPGIAPTHGFTSSGHSTRVRTEHLDQLQQLIRDLVDVHDQMTQDAAVRHRAPSALDYNVARARQLSLELQDLGNTIQSVSIRTAFQQIVRYASDVARKTGKSVQCTVSGDDILVDRYLVELLADPFVHMVRNAIDHGIESADERIRLGKPATGNIELRCQKDDHGIVVQLRDDGRGFDRENIVSRAEQMGLIMPGEAVPEDQLWSMVFAPGFTTASQVTALSGRGVGMDVVQRNVGAAGGKISITTTPGIGTTFTLSFPPNAVLNEEQRTSAGRSMTTD